MMLGVMIDVQDTPVARATRSEGGTGEDGDDLSVF